MRSWDNHKRAWRYIRVVPVMSISSPFLSLHGKSLSRTAGATSVVTIILMVGKRTYSIVTGGSRTRRFRLLEDRNPSKTALQQFNKITVWFPRCQDDVALIVESSARDDAWSGNNANPRWGLWLHLNSLYQELLSLSIEEQNKGKGLFSATFRRYVFRWFGKMDYGIPSDRRQNLRHRRRRCHISFSLYPSLLRHGAEQYQHHNFAMTISHIGFRSFEISCAEVKWHWSKAFKFISVSSKF